MGDCLAFRIPSDDPCGVVGGPTGASAHAQHRVDAMGRCLYRLSVFAVDALDHRRATGSGLRVLRPHRYGDDLCGGGAQAGASGAGIRVLRHGRFHWRDFGDVPRRTSDRVCGIPGDDCSLRAGAIYIGITAGVHRARVRASA